MKRFQISILIATTYLIIYVVMIQANVAMPFIWVAFGLSPIVVLWMVYEILKDPTYKGRELKEGEEYGYEDRTKEQLGVF